MSLENAFNTFFEHPCALFTAVNKKEKKSPAFRKLTSHRGKSFFSSLGPSSLICQNEGRLDSRRRVSFSSHLPEAKTGTHGWRVYLAQAHSFSIGPWWSQPPPSPRQRPAPSPRPSTQADIPATTTEVKPKNIPSAIFCRAEGSSLQRSSKGSSRWSFTGTRISNTTTLARRSQASGIWERRNQERQASRAEGALGWSPETWTPSRLSLGDPESVLSPPLNTRSSAV